MEDRSYRSTKIGIIGLGLIGGSIARALTGKVGVRSVKAVDSDEDSLKKALSDSVISQYSLDLRTLDDCDLIYVCIPVGGIPALLDELSSWYSGIVTDVASTKENIVSYARSRHPAMRFIGGHPMAGSEKVGYAASNGNLFENAPYILCPKRAESLPDSMDPDLQMVKDLAVRMDAVPIEMTPKDHDAAVGLVSHLPHVVAYAIVDLVLSKGDSRLKTIAAGGFRDITRIASSDPGLWADILCDSGASIVELLEEYIGILTEMKDTLGRRDRASLYKTFSNAKKYRDQLPMAANAKNQPVQLWIEVDDKPGMIGRIAVLFGDRGINIKNINIQDNRAYEGGSLRITLSSLADAEAGAEILKKEKLTVRIIE